MKPYVLFAGLFVTIALHARLGENATQLTIRYKDHVLDDVGYYGNKLMDYSPLFKSQLYALQIGLLEESSAVEIAQLQGMSMKGTTAIALAEELSGVARTNWIAKGKSAKQQTFEASTKGKDGLRKIMITMTDWIGTQRTPMVTIYVRTEKFEKWLLQQKKEKGEPPKDEIPEIVGAPRL